MNVSMKYIYATKMRKKRVRLKAYSNVDEISNEKLKAI